MVLVREAKCTYVHKKYISIYLFTVSIYLSICLSVRLSVCPSALSVIIINRCKLMGFLTTSDEQDSWKDTDRQMV